MEFIMLHQIVDNSVIPNEQEWYQNNIVVIHCNEIEYIQASSRKCTDWPACLKDLDDLKPEMLGNSPSCIYLSAELSKKLHISAIGYIYVAEGVDFIFQQLSKK